MTRFELADHRIAELELDLARAQCEVTPVLIEGALVLKALQTALSSAIVIARAAAMFPIDEHVEGIGRDFFGGGE
jgi:hypothetical protein